MDSVSHRKTRNENYPTGNYLGYASLQSWEERCKSCMRHNHILGVNTHFRAYFTGFGGYSIWTKRFQIEKSEIELVCFETDKIFLPMYQENQCVLQLRQGADLFIRKFDRWTTRKLCVESQEVTLFNGFSDTRKDFSEVFFGHFHEAND